MTQMSHSVHADTLARVARAARELGADLCRSRAPEQQRASSLELYAVWERAFEACGEAVIDRVTRGITLEELGVFGFAALTAPTALQSVEGAARNYAWITCDGRWRVEHDTDEVTLRFERPHAASLGRRVSDESALAQFLACMQQATHTPVPVKRLTTRVAPLAPQTLERLAGRRPERGHRDAITLDRAALERPCVRAHAPMHRYFCQQIESLVAPLRVRTWTEGVREAIGYALEAEALCGEAVAHTLGVSFRTMQRRLRSEGSNYRALSEELRAGHARSLLERGMRVEDAARSAGYADSSAFHRAFRRWQSESPGAFARRVRGAAGE